MSEEGNTSSEEGGDRVRQGDPEKEKLQMKGITRRSGDWLIGAGVGLAALSVFFAFVPSLAAQAKGGQDGPAPRAADGHPDLSGRYRYVGGSSSQEKPAFKPETKAKSQYSAPKGACIAGGTPTSITVQATEHGAFQLLEQPGVLWVLTESPQSVRWVPTDGRPHTKDPDISFAGESFGRWDGETLVVDTVGVDARMRNISVGAFGANSWTHSDEERVTEHFSRPSKNSLIYQVTIDDPTVLAKPWTSAPVRWSLAEGANDRWKPKVPVPGCDF